MNLKVNYKLLCYLLVFLFLSFGCASTQVTEVVHPDGQPAPNPYYVLETLDPSQPMRVSFYHVINRKVEDIDRTRQPHDIFLSRQGAHYFSTKDIGQVNTVLRVLNPWNKKYTVYYNITVIYSNGGQLNSRSELAYSDMKYREFYCPIPLTDGIRKGTHEIEITNDRGETVARTGVFRYFVNQTEGG